MKRETLHGAILVLLIGWASWISHEVYQLNGLRTAILIVNEELRGIDFGGVEGLEWEPGSVVTTYMLASGAGVHDCRGKGYETTTSDCKSNAVEGDVHYCGNPLSPPGVAPIMDPDRKRLCLDGSITNAQMYDCTTDTYYHPATSIATGHPCADVRALYATTMRRAVSLIRKGEAEQAADEMLDILRLYE